MPGFAEVRTEGTEGGGPQPLSAGNERSGSDRLMERVAGGTSSRRKPAVALWWVCGGLIRASVRHVHMRHGNAACGNVNTDAIRGRCLDMQPAGFPCGYGASHASGTQSTACVLAHPPFQRALFAQWSFACVRPGRGIHCVEAGHPVARGRSGSRGRDPGPIERRAPGADRPAARPVGPDALPGSAGRLSRAATGEMTRSGPRMTSGGPGAAPPRSEPLHPYVRAAESRAVRRVSLPAAECGTRLDGTDELGYPHSVLQ